MRTITQILFIFHFSFILIGCVFSNCEKINLKKEDLVKLVCYNKLKFLIFKSNKGNIDTLTLISNTISYSSCNKLELSNYQYQSLQISFKSSSNHGDTHTNISFSLDNKYRDDSSAIFYLSVYNVMVEFDNFELIDTIKNKHLSKIFICKKYKREAGLGSGKQNEIHNFHWSDSMGLVRYTTHGGEKYDLSYKY